MAMGKLQIYNRFPFNGVSQATLQDGASVSAALFLSTSNAAGLANEVLADLTDEHANANGYTTGGQGLASVTWTESVGTSTLDADDFLWTASGGTIEAKYVVYYLSGVYGSLTDPLIGVADTDTSDPDGVTRTDGQEFKISLTGTGILTAYADNA